MSGVALALPGLNASMVKALGGVVGVGAVMKAVGKEGKTKLFRAVSEAEFKQIQRTHRFEVGPNSLGGKFFAESIDDAKRWGNVLNGEGNYRIVETEIQKNIADGMQRWERLDGIGPARYGELNQLQDAVIREVK